jgi:ribosomal protein S18 acetylase RimI-like enzyme
MNTQIRSAKESDLNTVLEFMNEYYEIEGIEFSKIKSYNTLLEFLESSSGKLFMIEISNRPIGYFCLAFSYTLEIYGKDCFLDEIFIESKSRHMGIGTKVMSLIENYLKENNFKAMHLIVNNRNNVAFNYYLKNGFILPDSKFMSKKLI